MLKNISSLGITLNKSEQQSINGGGIWGTCNSNFDCKQRWASHPIFQHEGFRCWVGQCEIL